MRWVQERTTGRGIAAPRIHEAIVARRLPRDQPTKTWSSAMAAALRSPRLRSNTSTTSPAHPFARLHADCAKIDLEGDGELLGSARPFLVPDDVAVGVEHEPTPLVLPHDYRIMRRRRRVAPFARADHAAQNDVRLLPVLTRQMPTGQLRPDHRVHTRCPAVVQVSCRPHRGARAQKYSWVGLA